MQIYLNTRGFEQDYQWFNIGEDNSISVTKNFWEMREISNIPINDEFSLVLGKYGENELFLLATDLSSNRFDNKEREIKNSLLFISENEIVLRKLSNTFLFDHEEFVEILNSVIAPFNEGEFGFSVEYSGIIKAVDSFLDRYDVKYEFDANTSEKRYSRFAELYLKYSTISDDGEEVIEYRINPIFEFKLKRFLLSEIFPEDIEIIFAYFSNLTLGDIEKSEIYLSVGKSLDRFAKNIFVRDLEDWAKIEIKEKKFNKFKEKFQQYRSEFIVSILALVIFFPLVYSYISLTSENSSLKQENTILKSEKIQLEIDRKSAEEKFEQIKKELTLMEINLSNLSDDLEAEKGVVLSLEKRINKDNGAKNFEELNDKILTLRNELGRCEDKYQKESEQRNKLSVGYTWYKDLYNKCNGGK
jgi:hypothetical protein